MPNRGIRISGQDGGVAPTGNYDIRFQLYDALTGGSVINRGVTIDTDGDVEIAADGTGQVSIGGPTPSNAKLNVKSPGTGVLGVSTGTSGELSVGVYGINSSGSGYAGYFQGRVAITVLGEGGLAPLCHSGSLISSCSSSFRYKKEMEPFGNGLSFINKLRPLSFRWKSNDALDVGFSAEDVAKIDPLFVTYNKKGEIEGVKYDRLSVVFVNAFKEQQARLEKQDRHIEKQQAQIERQQREIAELRQAVLALRPKARARSHRRR